ncbi:MAG: ATP phosphoribosyltransferase regulatory subunit [Clostridiales Family XIII bacterium]|jgi:ATP phosphoribosyltransferase regulatory subunit|nr:ATP phosphoribosyltransferase regulatory subunit [Clostridiales Family XIII bacterium]
MIRNDKITPEGTGDLLFLECEAQNAVIGLLREGFEKRGYREVRTPGLEFYDVFSSKAAYYRPESMYKLTDDRGRLMAVRPDSTIPIARMTATKLKGSALPIRIYYAQQVFRRQPELRGKRAEIMQMGIELIGDAAFESDVEILTAAAESLAACSPALFRIELGHVGVFNRLMSLLEAGPEEKERIHGHIAAKNYAALSDVLEGTPQTDVAEMLRALPRLFGGAEALEEARALFRGRDPVLPEMLAYLERIYGVLRGLDLGDRIMIDLGLVNQAEYYSSLAFKGYTDFSGDAVLFGGRYDGLFKDFGEDLPATGFAVHVDALADGRLKRSLAACGAPREPGPGEPGLPPSESKAPAPAVAPQETARLRIALTKGRLEDAVVAMLARAGCDVGLLRDKGRRLLLPIPGTNMEVVLAKAADVITYVEHGVCDVGVVGKDTIAERGGVYYEILDLGVGKCRFALAARADADFYGGFGAKRIATKYPNVASSWFESKGMDVEIIRIEGSVELAPLLGLADGIVDIVETGGTLRENGLTVIEDIRPVSARMIVNVASMKLKKKEIDALAANLQEVRGE